MATRRPARRRALPASHPRKRRFSTNEAGSTPSRRIPSQPAFRAAMRAAPRAPVTRGSGGTIRRSPSSSPRAEVMASFRATPPVKATGGRIPTRPAMPATRRAIERTTPAAISPRGTPWASMPITSDSAKTTHMELISDPAPAARARLGQAGDIGAEDAGDDLEEAAAARGAAVVHGEIADPAVLLQEDGLAVLAADVDDRPHAGKDRGHAEGVAGDLGRRLVGEGGLDAAVARGHDPAKVVASRSRPRRGRRPEGPRRRRPGRGNHRGRRRRRPGRRRDRRGRP